MLKGLGCIALFFFLMFVVLSRLLHGVFRFLFGIGTGSRPRRNAGYYGGDGRRSAHTGGQSGKKKVIPDDVGEYVEYEDVEDK